MRRPLVSFLIGYLVASLVAIYSFSPTKMTGQNIWEQTFGPQQESKSKSQLTRPNLKPKQKWVAKVVFRDKVSAESAASFVEALEEVQAAQVDYIVLEIDTPGGSVSAGRMISRAIESSPIPIVCIVDGDAASMGAYILQSCDVRIMTKRSAILFHEPSVETQVEGPQRQFENIRLGLAIASEMMAEHESHRLKISKAEFKKHIEGGQDWWLLWGEALKIGAIDCTTRSVETVLKQMKDDKAVCPGG